MCLVQQCFICKGAWGQKQYLFWIVYLLGLFYIAILAALRDFNANIVLEYTHCKVYSYLIILSLILRNIKLIFQTEQCIQTEIFSKGFLCCSIIVRMNNSTDLVQWKY